MKSISCPPARKYIRLAIVLIITAFLPLPSQAARGRVSIKNGTVVTDANNLLRGCMTATDSIYGVNMPPRSVLTAIKQYGMNALHLYGEKPALTVGSRVSYIDTYVQWTREENLYLVLTIGDSGNDTDFVLDFWEFYADRYKDETHVIFEIKNEPEHYNFSNPPYQSSTIDMERQAYFLIRSLAPDSHIMFFSYAAGGNGATGATGFQSDIAALGSGINWSNASVAFHAYSGQGRELEEYIYAIKGLGYPMICTEFETDLTPYANPIRNVTDDVRAMENTYTSWLNFYTIGQMADETRFVHQIETAKIGWTPDFGTWPGVPGPPIGKIISLRGYNKEFVSCENVGDPMWCDRETYDFDRYEQFFVVDRGNGKIALQSIATNKYASSENGTRSMQCNRNWPSSWEDFTWTYYANSSFSLRGNNNKYVTSNNGTSAMWCNRDNPYGWEKFTWLEGEQVHVAPGLIEAEDFDVGGEGIAYHDTTPRNQSGAYRLDPSDVDIEVCAEGGYNVGRIVTGEWLAYTVKVQSAGTYEIEVRVATDRSGAFHVEFNDVNETGTINFGNTGGWQSWTSITTQVELNAGWQVMRLVMEKSEWNLNSIRLTKLN